MSQIMKNVGQLKVRRKTQQFLQTQSRYFMDKRCSFYAFTSRAVLL
jgi:hypothetical protein